jgi:hypothetical protein
MKKKPLLKFRNFKIVKKSVRKNGSKKKEQTVSKQQKDRPAKRMNAPKKLSSKQSKLQEMLRLISNDCRQPKKKENNLEKKSREKLSARKRLRIVPERQLKMPLPQQKKRA